MAGNSGKKSLPSGREKLSAKKAAKTAKPLKSEVRTARKKSPARALRKSPLTKAELAEFRKMLLEKRRDIIGDMNGIQAETLKNRQGASGDLSNMPTHLADIGTDNFEHEFSLGLLESERALLKEIDEALERIEHNTYGICMGTGEAIGKARLRARPWAKYCIEYARMLEKGLVRPAEKRISELGEGDEEGDSDEAAESEEDTAEEAPEADEAAEDREPEDDDE